MVGWAFALCASVCGCGSGWMWAFVLCGVCVVAGVSVHVWVRWSVDVLVHVWVWLRVWLCWCSRACELLCEGTECLRRVLIGLHGLDKCVADVDAWLCCRSRCRCWRGRCPY